MLRLNAVETLEVLPVILTKTFQFVMGGLVLAYPGGPRHCERSEAIQR